LHQLEIDMPTRNSSSRAPRRGSAKNQIIEMLKSDHKKVKKAFRDFEKLDPQEEAERCEALVEQTCAELEVHTQLEEQWFYPAAREAVKEQDLLDEAEVEHMSAKVLIEQLKEMSAEDEKFAATFKVLGEYVNHHIKEEEGELFKQMTRTGVDWESTLEQMQIQRAQLLQENGLSEEGEDQEAGALSRRTGGHVARSGTPAGQRSHESRPQAASQASDSKTESSASSAEKE
jgi:hypothetical protein